MRSPQETLLKFMRRMNKWEKTCLERQKLFEDGQVAFEEVAAAGEAEFRRIFDRYCARSAIPRSYCFSDPPEYDSQNEEILYIVHESDDFVTIETLQHYGFRERHLYRLTVQDGEWRIVDKQIILDSGELLADTL